MTHQVTSKSRSPSATGGEDSGSKQDERNSVAPAPSTSKTMKLGRASTQKSPGSATRAQHALPKSPFQGPTDNTLPMTASSTESSNVSRGLTVGKTIKRDGHSINYTNEAMEQVRKRVEQVQAQAQAQRNNRRLSTQFSQGNTPSISVSESMARRTSVSVARNASLGTDGVGTGHNSSSLSSSAYVSRRPTQEMEYMNFGDLASLVEKMGGDVVSAGLSMDQGSGSVDRKRRWSREWNEMVAPGDQGRKASQRSSQVMRVNVGMDSLPEGRQLKVYDRIPPPLSARHSVVGNDSKMKNRGNKDEQLGEQGAPPGPVLNDDDDAGDTYTWNGKVLEEKIHEKRKQIALNAVMKKKRAETASTQTILESRRLVKGKNDGFVTDSELPPLIPMMKGNKEVEIIKEPKLGKYPFFSDPVLVEEENVLEKPPPGIIFPTEQETRQRSVLHAIRSDIVARYEDVRGFLKWGITTNALRKTPSNPRLWAVNPIQVRNGGDPLQGAGKEKYPQIVAADQGDTKISTATGLESTTDSIRPATNLPKEYALLPKLKARRSNAHQQQIHGAEDLQPEGAGGELSEVEHHHVKRTLLALRESHTTLVQTHKLPNSLSKSRTLNDLVLAHWLLCGKEKVPDCLTSELNGSLSDSFLQLSCNKTPEGRFVDAKGPQVILQRHAAFCFGFEVSPATPVNRGKRVSASKVSSRRKRGKRKGKKPPNQPPLSTEDVESSESPKAPELAADSNGPSGLEEATDLDTVGHQLNGWQETALMTETKI